MNPINIKRSIVRNGQKTSVSLEKEFWEGLREIASQQRISLSTLVSQIAKTRTGKNLSSAIRVFVLNHLCAQNIGADASKHHHRAAERQPTKPTDFH